MSSNFNNKQESKFSHLGKEFDIEDDKYTYRVSIKLIENPNTKKSYERLVINRYAGKSSTGTLEFRGVKGVWLPTEVASNVACNVFRKLYGKQAIPLLKKLKSLTPVKISSLKKHEEVSRK